MSVANCTNFGLPRIKSEGAGLPEPSLWFPLLLPGHPLWLSQPQLPQS